MIAINVMRNSTCHAIGGVVFENATGTSIVGVVLMVYTNYTLWRVEYEF
jgi:hypothetical protein